MPLDKETKNLMEKIADDHNKFLVNQINDYLYKHIEKKQKETEKRFDGIEKRLETIESKLNVLNNHTKDIPKMSGILKKSR